MRALKSAAAVVVLLAAAACGPLKYEIKGTPQAVGADAVITADVKKEQNFTLVEVKAMNLPPPDRVMAGSTNFIAWQRKGNDATWSRVGTLVYDQGARTGALTATVPELRFDFEITAEQQDAPASPSAEVVFFQKVGN